MIFIVVVSIIVLVIGFVSSAAFGFNNPNLPQLVQELFGGNPASFFMPNNKSVVGNFSFDGTCLNGGVEIKEGTICATRLEVFNITSVNVTKQNVTVLENFIVEGNITADFYFGNGSQLTGIIHTSPGGSDTQVQFNDGGGFGGSVGFTFDKSTGDVNITGNLTVDSNTLFVDSNTDRVGINTSTPQNTLNVIGDGNFTGDIYSNSYQVISYQRTVNIKNVTMTAVI